MSDLIERLRAIPVWMVGAMTPGWQGHGATAYEAADAIESLRAENARLTEERDALVTGLRKIAEYPYRYGQHVQRLKVIAATALAKVKGGTDAR